MPPPVEPPPPTSLRILAAFAVALTKEPTNASSHCCCIGIDDFVAAWGQSRQVPAADQDRPIVLSGGTIHTVLDADPIVSGFVRIENGLITQVGGDPILESGDQFIDCQGVHVYPGMILIDTQLGLYETSAVEVTLDYNGSGSITPEAMLLAINPDSDLIPVTRSNGVLTGVVAPSGGLVAGWEATVRFEVGLGKTWPFNLNRACSSTDLELVLPRAAERFEELDTLIRDARAGPPLGRLILRSDPMLDSMRYFGA